MKTLHLEISSQDVELIEAFKTVVFDIRHELFEKNITLKVDHTNRANESILIDDLEMSLACSCNPGSQQCHCSLESKIRKNIYRHLNLRESSCCGGNCGCS